MSCSFAEKISSLIDGELSQTEAREVERHVLNCSECEQVRADFLSLRSQIASYESSLELTVQNRALKKILAPRRSAGLRWAFATPAIAFATLLIIGAIVGLLFYQSKHASQSQTTAQVQTPAPAPSASVEKNKQAAAEASPEPSRETPSTPPNKNEKETTHPQREPATPVKRPLVREPKPGEQFASVPERVRSADAETMTAIHFETSETLLLAFKNVRLDEPGAAAEVSHERKRAKQLVYQNMMLRREADTAGDVQISSLLESLEPILIDIANLPDQPDPQAIRVIRERVERKNIVALLRVNSTALARAWD